MTRIIRASEVKPGMEVEWTHAGITRKCVGSVVESAGPQRDVKLRTFEGGAVHIPRDVEVTVLSEPAPVRPEEPTVGGARVVVDGRRFIRADNDSLPWVELDVWDWHNWDSLCEMGHVQVIPDPGWTIPRADESTPEVPDRIDEWPEDDRALREHKWRDQDRDILSWAPAADKWECYGVSGDYVASYDRPLIRGPWTRVTDA